MLFGMVEFGLCNIFEIKKQIIQNQNNCPHFDLDYSWPVIDGKCPYCGRNLEGIL